MTARGEEVGPWPLNMTARGDEVGPWPLNVTAPGDEVGPWSLNNDNKRYSAAPRPLTISL